MSAFIGCETTFSCCVCSSVDTFLSNQIKIASFEFCWRSFWWYFNWLWPLCLILQSKIDNFFLNDNSWCFLDIYSYIKFNTCGKFFSKRVSKMTRVLSLTKTTLLRLFKVDVWILSKDAKLSKICYVSLWYVNNLLMDLIHTNMICFISLKLFKSLNIRQSMMFTVCKMHKKEELNISGFKKEKKQWLT